MFTHADIHTDGHWRSSGKEHWRRQIGRGSAVVSQLPKSKTCGRRWSRNHSLFPNCLTHCLIFSRQGNHAEDSLVPDAWRPIMNLTEYIRCPCLWCSKFSVNSVPSPFPKLNTVNLIVQLSKLVFSSKGKRILVLMRNVSWNASSLKSFCTCSILILFFMLFCIELVRPFSRTSLL